MTRKIAGAEVRFRFADGAGPPPGAVVALLALERIILQRSRQSYCDRLEADEGECRAKSDFEPDAVIDCTGRDDTPIHPAAALVLRPLFDGAPAETVAIAALLSGDIPEIAIEDRRSGAVLAIGKASGEAAQGLTGGLNAVLSRTITLVERILLSPRQSFAAAATRSAKRADARLVARFALRNLATDCARAIYHLCLYSPHWRIGWRWNEGPGVIERGDLGGPRWQVLGDPGTRFFADPFPVAWGGRLYVFFEDLDHRVGKGTISAIEFGQDGPRGEAVPVLEEPWHLSYPFIMEHDGALWMAPESSLSGSVPLYRCIEFPHRWERVATLLDGIEAADNTIFRHDGLFWMMSAIREGIGGYSDILAIHHAPTLMGPWEPHGQRPVLVDAGVARPAGAVVERDGQLWRPVQDCTRGYGRAMNLARIDRLDRDHFAQTIEARLGPGPLWPGARLHTLNRCGRLECIDGAIFNPRIGALRSLATARMVPRESSDHSPDPVAVL